MTEKKDDESKFIHIENRNQKLMDDKSEDEKKVDAQKKSTDDNIKIDDSDELRDDLKRIAAEFDNYKKRVEREKQQARLFERSHVLSHFLILKDEFEQATAHEKESEGLKLLAKKLDSILNSLDVKEVDCSGECDHRFHEVMMQIPGGEQGKIAQVIRKGYLVGDILLRPAQVCIYSGKREWPEEKEDKKKSE
jgi:molecular chaperone GrpE